MGRSETESPSVSLSPVPAQGCQPSAALCSLSPPRHPECGGAVGEPGRPGADHPAQPGGTGPSRRHGATGGAQGHGQWPIA